MKLVNTIRPCVQNALLILATVAVTLSATNLQPVAAAEVKTITYYHVDDLGSPIATTLSDGDVKWRNFHSPYGVRYSKPGLDSAVNGNGVDLSSTGEAESASGRLGFTGHVEDRIGDRQLIYMQARYYDPAIGRFLSPDPVGFSEENPMSFNRYDYANANPLAYTDPNGESPFEVFTELFPAAGRSFAGLAAWGVGHITGDQALINAALEGMAAQQSENLFALGSIVAPPGANKARKAANLRKTDCRQCTCSFEGSTEVLTATGYTAISALNDTDTVVLTRNELTGKQEWKPVLDHYANEYADTVYVTVQDSSGSEQTIISNRIHPFFVKDDKSTVVARKVSFSYGAENYAYSGLEPMGRWIDAANLRRGDLLLDAENQWATITNVRVTGQNLLAFNLDVQGNDNFFVRASAANDTNGVWVHNCNNVPKDIEKSVSRREAFRKAKRDAGIPTSQTHKTHTKKLKADGLDSKRTATEFDFGGGKKVQHHPAGHKFRDGGEYNKPHFNNHGTGGTKRHYEY